MIEEVSDSPVLVLDKHEDGIEFVCIVSIGTEFFILLYRSWDRGLGGVCHSRIE